MYEWYSKTWGEVVDELHSDDRKGLSLEKISNIRKNNNSSNTFSNTIKSKSYFSILIKQLFQMWSLMLLITSILLFLSKSYVAFIIVFTVYIAAIYIVTSKEYVKEKDLKELERLKPATIRVLRSSKIFRIPAEELVVGDIVFVEKGEIVPQDLRIIESKDLKVKETAITGENYAIEKYGGKIDEKELSLNDMTNILFRSSIIKEGSGTGIVIACGKDTQIEKSMRMVYEEKKDKVLFKKNIFTTINRYSIFSLCIEGLFIVFSLIHHFNVDYIVYWSSVILTASVPILAMGIVIYVSLISIHKLKEQGVHIREISVLDILSKINVFCLDKVGTLTEENFYPETIYTDNKSISINAATLSPNENISTLLGISVICNDLKTSAEINIIKTCEENGIIKTQLERRQRRLMNIPYDSSRKIMTTINKHGRDYRANCKGDVDSILTRCTNIMKDGKEEYLFKQDITNIKKKHIQLSISGKEVMAFAYRDFNYQPTLDENLESNLVFVGLMSFENPVLGEASESLKCISQLEIKPLIITDENKLSASYMQRKLDIEYGPETVLAGVELANAEEDEFKRIIPKANVLSKITASQRTKIVKTFKESGLVTGCTVSKLIHMPTLRTADVGIAIGKQCSVPIKKLADIYVEPSSISALVKAMKNGSKLVNSTYKALDYTFFCAVSSAISIFLMMIFSSKFILLPEQIFIPNLFNVIMGTAAILCDYQNQKEFKKYPLYMTIVDGAIIGTISTVSLIIGLKYSSNFASSLGLILISLSTIVFTYKFNNRKVFGNLKSNGIVILNLLTQISIFIACYPSRINIVKWILLFLIIEVPIVFLHKNNEKRFKFSLFG